MAEVTLVMKGVDAASSVVDGLSGAITGLGAVAASVAATGLAALGAGLAISLSAAMENEKAQASLEQTIKSTGGAAGLTAEAANDLATQFMNLAGGSDDAILAIETIGLRAGTVSADEMPAFIQATLDLGTVMGDTAGAATLLARAQDDPEAAFKRIERATGAYDSALEEQIKTLVAAGDNAGAVELIMGKLAETTGGAAAANAGTLAGQWEIFKGSIGEAFETVGTAVLPVARELFDNVIAPAIPIVQTIAAALADFLGTFASGDFEDPIGNLANLFYEVANALGLDGGGIFAAIIGLREPFDAFIANAKTQAETFMANIQPIIDAVLNVAAAFVENLPMMQQYFADMVAFIIAQVNILSPTLITNVTTTLNELAAFWREHGDEVMAVVNFVFRTLIVTIGGALTIISGLVSATMLAINGDWTGAWEAIKSTTATFMNSVLSIVGTDLDTFIATWTANWEMAKLIVTTLWTQLTDAVAAKVMELTGGIQQGIIDSIIWLQTLPATFTQLGTDLMEGLKSGVLSAAAGLIAAVTGSVGDAIAAAKALLGIASPSRVFAGIGENMMEGMAQGIASGAGGAVTATTMATSAVTNNAASTVNNWNITAPQAAGWSLADEVRLLQTMSASA